MSRRSPAPSVPDAGWRELQQRFPDHPHLDDESLLALPEAFLSALRECVPGLLTRQEVEFEQALRETGSTGFFRQQRLVSTVLEPGPAPDEQASRPPDATAAEGHSHRGQQALLDVLQCGAISLQVAIDRQDREWELIEAEHLRLRGYAGYLLANPVFRADVAYLRAYLSDPPDLAIAPTLADENSLPPGPESPAFRSDLVRIHARQFLGRWSLNRMLTWDIPDPTPAAIHPRDTGTVNPAFPAGITLFLPWSLLADHAFTDQFVDSYQRCRVDLRHLADWIEQRQEWGPLRYSRLLEYFVYRHLVLETRYATSLRRRTGWVDQAFQKLWGLPYTAASGPEQRAEVHSTLKKIKAHLKRGRTATSREELCVFFRPSDAEPSHDG